MKIAISTENGSVAAHFGRCPAYTVVHIEENKVKSREEIPNPGHRPGFLPEYLADRGVGCIIAGGMGPRAQDLFAQKNIATLIGIQGTVDEVLDKFLKDELEAGTDLCNHQHGHGPTSEESSHVMPTPIPPGAKICLTAKDNSLEAEMDPHFGRAPYFLILDPGTRQIEAIRNPYAEETQGAGIRAAQMLADKGVRIILTGQVGPNAEKVLQTAGIQLVSAATGTVKENIQSFVQGIE